MAGGDVEAPGRGGGGGGAGGRVCAAHLAAAVLGLVAVVCSGTWLGVLPGGAGHAMNYLFTAASMQLSYNVSGCFREVKLLFAGGSKRSFTPAGAVNQFFFVFPPLDVAAAAVQGKSSAHPEGARPSIDQLCWVERIQLSSKAIGFWNEHAPDELQTGGGQPRSAGKSPSRQATFD